MSMFVLLINHISAATLDLPTQYNGYITQVDGWSSMALGSGSREKSLPLRQSVNVNSHCQQCIFLLATGGSQRLFAHSVYNCLSLLLPGHQVEESCQWETAQTNIAWISKRRIGHRKQMNQRI